MSEYEIDRQRRVNDFLAQMDRDLADPPRSQFSDVSNRDFERWRAQIDSQAREALGRHQAEADWFLVTLKLLFIAGSCLLLWKVL